MKKIQYPIEFEYTENVIPKRCRKERPVRFNGKMQVSIHALSANEAPVAIIQNEFSYEKNEYEKRVTYRYYKNKLWTLYKHQAYSHAPLETITPETFQEKMIMYRSHYWRGYMTKQESRINSMSWAKSFVFIDGLLWQKTGEPRYVVMTFGLGCNHGIGWGTSLGIDNNYNCNISKDRYFRIDQFETAVTEATRIATNRGDTKSLPIIEEQHPETFEILIPEVLKLNPNKEHGDGDPFINKIEKFTELKNPTVAGILGIMEAFSS